MNRDNERQSAIILSVIGIIPVVWLALLIAPSVKGGLPEILPSLLTAFNEPFHIELCEDSLKTVLVLLLCYAMGIGIYFSTQKNYRRREEHGSAKWGNARAVNKKYRQSPASANKLMTQNVCIGLNAKKHRRNLNTLVCGGSGAGKTRFYCKPNLMQCNTSFVILDPKGEILRDTGKLLESKGYEVRVLDLISMEKSHCYNPFVYLQNDNDVQKLVTNLFKSTTPKGSQSQDPFWDTSASMLLLALVFYLHYEAPEDEQNFAMIKDTFKEKIWGLPAADLLGVGRATQRVLDSYCIRTIGDLANNDPEFLRRRLGKNGVVLWNYANGNDLSLVAKKDFVSPIKSVGHGITTVADLEKPEQVWPVFLELTQDIGHKLRVHGLSAEGVAIHIRDNTLNTRQWQTKIALPTQSPMIIAKTAFQLFEKRYGWNNPIRSVTVQAINLIPQDTPRQIDMFMDAAKQDKLERMEKCVEEIRRRFGKDSIRNGVLCQNLRLPPEKAEITMPTGMVG